MKKILLPTDFSQNADDALKYCMQLLGDSFAEIVLFHVISTADSLVAVPEGTAIMMTQNIKEAKRNLAKLKVKANNYIKEFQNQNIVVTTDFTIGDAGKSIISKASELESDVVIMGRRGGNYLLIDKLIGTVSSQVINASVPVILVPGGYSFKEIDNIIFPTKLDRKDPYDLNTAMNIIGPNSPVVQCIHLVKNEEEKNKKEVKEFANYIIEHSPSVQTTFFIELSDDVSTTIDEYAASYDAELIVMPKKGKNFFERLITKNHIKEMLWITKRPIMIVN